MSVLSFFVHGLPAPQGSKRYVGNGVMVESSKKVKPWRQNVVQAAREAIAHFEGFEPLAGPVQLGITFYFPRPKSHFGTGRNAQRLKDTAPHYVTSHHSGDLDKLIRSTSDGLETAGVLRDDSLISISWATKVYGETPGARISVELLTVNV